MTSVLDTLMAIVSHAKDFILKWQWGIQDPIYLNVFSSNNRALKIQRDKVNIINENSHMCNHEHARVTKLSSSSTVLELRKKGRRVLLEK